MRRHAALTGNLQPVWLSARWLIAWRDDGIGCTVQNERIAQPECVLLASESVVRRAVNTPSSKHVANVGGSSLQTQDSVRHVVVEEGHFLPFEARVWNEFKLNDAIPLEIVLCSLFRKDLSVNEADIRHSSEYEVFELGRHPIKGSNMPTDACVDQAKRYQLSLGQATRCRVVGQADSPVAMNGPGDWCQHIHLGEAKRSGEFAADQ